MHVRMFIEFSNNWSNIENIMEPANNSETTIQQTKPNQTRPDQTVMPKAKYKLRLGFGSQLAAATASK